MSFIKYYNNIKILNHKNKYICTFIFIKLLNYIKKSFLKL